MAEILKAESYTSVMKTSHEDVYTLFIEAESQGGVALNLLGDGASVGAYNLHVAENLYTLTIQPPTGFKGDSAAFLGTSTKDPQWNFLGAPTVQLVYPDSSITGDVVVPQICAMDFVNINNGEPNIPIIRFAFFKRTGTVTPVLTSVPAPLGSKIHITVHYTTSKNK